MKNFDYEYLQQDSKQPCSCDPYHDCGNDVPPYPRATRSVTWYGFGSLWIGTDLEWQ